MQYSSNTNNKILVLKRSKELYNYFFFIPHYTHDYPVVDIPLIIKYAQMVIKLPNALKILRYNWNVTPMPKYFQIKSFRFICKPSKKSCNAEWFLI